MNRKFRRMMRNSSNSQYAERETFSIVDLNKISYHQNGRWHFCINDILWEYYKDQIDTILRPTFINSINMYLQPLPVFNVSDKDISAEHMSVDDIKYVDRENPRLIKRFARRSSDTILVVRLVSGRYVVVIKMSLLTVTRQSTDVSPQYSITIYVADKVCNYIAMANLNIDSNVSDPGDTRFSLRNAPYTTCPFVFITSPKNNIASRVCKFNSEVNEIEYIMIHSVNTAFHKLFDTNFLENKTLSAPVHDPLEMILFKGGIEDYRINNLVAPLYGYNIEDDVHPGEIILDDDYTDIPDYFGDTKMINTFPLIDLNDSENKFIHKYAISYAYGESGCLDVLKYIKDSRYGDTYKIDIGSSDHPIVIHYDFNEEKSIMRFTLSETLEDGCTYSAVMNFKDITVFNVIDNFINGASFITIPIKVDPPKSVSEFKDSIQLIDKNETYLLAVIRYVVDVLIAIHDRPERTKIVKAVDRKYYELKEKNRPAEEKDYIVVRILKTKRDAHEYVSKMIGRRASAEYSVEEWDRKGHWRTNKNGKTFWVSDTRCKRHLALSEKELKIKL